MTVKILSTQDIAELYGPIAAAQSSAFPRVSTDEVSAMMKDLMSGRAQQWAAYAAVDGRRQVQVMFTTRIWDDGFGRRVYLGTLASPGAITETEWETLLDKLIGYARENRCTYIEADTDVSQVLRLAAHLGFEIRSVKIVRRIEK